MSVSVGIFFDGTGNNKNDGVHTQTNVARLFDHYRSDSSHQKLYIRGVGSSNAGDSWFPDESPITRAFGAAFGAEGDERIAFVNRKLKKLHRDHGVSHLDLFGFSRGAALARHLTHVVRPLGIPIRYLGIFDTVGSFGRPGDAVNCGFNLSIDEDQIDAALHLTSFDEIRKNFDLVSLKKSKSQILPSHILEQEDVGVHSDIGGGYGLDLSHGMRGHQLAYISLKKMHEHALARQVPFKPLSDYEPEGALKQHHGNYHQLMAAYPELYPPFKEYRIYERSLPILKYKEPRVRVPGIRNSNAATRNRKRKEKQKLKFSITTLENRMAILTQQIEQLLPSADHRKFIKATEGLRDGYIHISHSPFNSTLGMMAQKHESKENQEPFVFYKRDVFFG